MKAPQFVQDFLAARGMSPDAWRVSRRGNFVISGAGKPYELYRYGSEVHAAHYGYVFAVISPEGKIFVETDEYEEYSC